MNSKRVRLGQWMWTVKGSVWVSGCEQWKGQTGSVDVNSERVSLGQWMWTVKGSDWVSGCEQWKGQSGSVGVNSEGSDWDSGCEQWRVRLGQWMMDMNRGIGLHSGSQWVTGDRPTVKGSDWDIGWGQWVIECSQSKVTGCWRWKGQIGRQQWKD